MAPCSAEGRVAPGTSRPTPDRGLVDLDEQVEQQDPGVLERGAPRGAQEGVGEVATLGGRQHVEVDPQDPHRLLSAVDWLISDHKRDGGAIWPPAAGVRDGGRAYGESSRGP